jgi:hypothetical protein
VPAGQLGVLPAQMAVGRVLIPRARSPTEVVTAGAGVAAVAAATAAGEEGAVAATEALEEGGGRAVTWVVTEFVRLSPLPSIHNPRPTRNRPRRIEWLGARGRIMRASTGTSNDSSRPRTGKS